VDEELISITEVCNETGLQSSALRYYERAGLIRPHSRIGGRRHYRRSVFQTLAAIALLQEVGFTISEIKTLLAGQEGRSAWRALADAKLRTIDDHIERASRARELLATALACECSSLHTCDLVEQRRSRHRKTVQRLGLPQGSGQLSVQR